MSVSRGNGQNGGHFYSNVTQPMELDLNFIVDSTNGNGLGIRSLKSNGYVRNVFMHTSATPGSNDNALNPNPAAGYALIQLKSNYRYYLGGFSGVVAPLTSTSATSTTAHSPYVITSLGTATLAQWQAAGLPAGLTPTVGQAFIAIATGTIGGSATVGSPAPSNISQVSVVGDPNQSLSNNSIAANGGAYILIQFAGPTSSSVTTPVATAPSDNSVVGMTIKLDISSVTIDGI